MRGTQFFSLVEGLDLSWPNFRERVLGLGMLIQRCGGVRAWYVHIECI
jgi:hypothetical protein